MAVAVAVVGGCGRYRRLVPKVHVAVAVVGERLRSLPQTCPQNPILPMLGVVVMKQTMPLPPKRMKLSALHQFPSGGQPHPDSTRSKHKHRWKTAATREAKRRTMEAATWRAGLLACWLVVLARFGGGLD